MDAGSTLNGIACCPIAVRGAVGNAVATTGATSARVTTALLTTTAGGLAPFMIGTWGGIDLIRDPYSGAQSGQVTLTALLTADVTVARASQLHLIKALPIPTA